MCASCGCGCKPGKAAKNCNCDCKTCKGARMSVEKSFVIAKALRGFDDIADVIFEDNIQKSFFDYQNETGEARVKSWKKHDSAKKDYKSAKKDYKSAKKEFRSAKRNIHQEFRDREAIAGDKHLKQYGGRQTLGVAGAGAAVGGLVGGRKGAAIGAGLGLAEGAANRAIYASRAKRARNRVNTLD